MKPINELSADELRREIGKHLGYNVRSEYLVWYLADDGYTRKLPDWPADAGVVLALCLYIGARHDWELVMISVNGVSSAQFVNATDYAVYGEIADTPALALARLALATLRAQESDDAH